MTTTLSLWQQCRRHDDMSSAACERCSTTTTTTSARRHYNKTTMSAWRYDDEHDVLVPTSSVRRQNRWAHDEEVIDTLSCQHDDINNKMTCGHRQHDDMPSLMSLAAQRRRWPDEDTDNMTILMSLPAKHRWRRCIQHSDFVDSTATSLSWQQWPCCAVQTTTSIRPMFSTWTNDNINFLSSINVLHKIWIGNLLNLSCTLWQVQVSAVACEPTLHHMYIVCYTKVDTLYGKLAIWREVRWSHLH